MKKIAPAWKWLLALVLIAIAVAAAFHFDPAMRGWMAAHRNRPAHHFMQFVSRFGDWPEHVVAGLLIVGIAFARGSKRWVRIGLTMLVACALAGVAARGVKIATGRARPSARQEMHWQGPRLSSRYNSFPSGHTAATVGFFGVLLSVRRGLGLALLPIPLLIATSRLYLGAHYLSDVVCGALLGIVCAWIAVRLLRAADT